MIESDIEIFGELHVTSDTHFSHGNIMRFCRRPGLTIEEQKLLDESKNFKVSWESINRMNEYLLEGINDCVGENDTLLHLGDWCLDRKNYFKTAQYFRNRIQCKNVYLVLGNHDTKEISSLFSAPPVRKIQFVYKGQVIVADHSAHAIWEHSKKKAWNLYGHSHSNAEDNLDQAICSYGDRGSIQRLSMDVGVDNAAKLLGAYRPFSFEEIKRIMDKRNGVSLDYH